MSEYNSTFVANRIKQLLKLQKISASKMLMDCGMNKNALYTMQSAGFLPRLEAVAQIADYLDCSVDYLLGRTDNPKSHLAPFDSAAADLPAGQNNNRPQRP